MTVSKTKAKLVDVARQLFAKMGVENTTMNDIALASKKGRRTLYTYFKSKDEIYLAVVFLSHQTSYEPFPPAIYHGRNRPAKFHFGKLPL